MLYAFRALESKAHKVRPDSILNTRGSPWGRCHSRSNENDTAVTPPGRQTLSTRLRNPQRSRRPRGDGASAQHLTLRHPTTAPPCWVSVPHAATLGGSYLQRCWGKGPAPGTRPHPGWVRDGLAAGGAGGADQSRAALKHPGTPSRKSVSHVPHTLRVHFAPLFFGAYTWPREVAQVGDTAALWQIQKLRLSDGLTQSHTARKRQTLKV